MKVTYNPFTRNFDFTVAPVPAITEENCLLALSGDQSNINVNTVIDLVDNVAGITINNGVTFNNITHIATLTGGKTYKLQAFLKHWGSAPNTVAAYCWWDVTNSVSLGIISESASLNMLSDDSNQPTATAIVTPSTTIEVELICTAVSAANQGLRVTASHAIIEKIYE